MPKAHFDIYRAQVFELAKTLVFKSVATALTINNELKMLGYEINEEDYRSWKYYLNLAGQYHSYDTVMTVTSLDTLQTIEFTTENLRIHRATAAAYSFGSRYYEELVNRYPAQEPLIQRILNPIDIDQAIAASDAEILWYASALTEDNETNLIPKLQEYINNVFARWNVAAYQTTDDLYVPAFLAMLYNFLPIAIMNIRNGNCHTRYAHSFHIREFLTSHGKLTPFLDYLTKKQLLWLYRNIRFIQRNPGKQDTLDWMIDNLLTPRRIPLSEWDMVHDLTGMPDEEMYPTVLFERTPMNFGYNFAGSDLKTLDEMLDDEQPIARGNARVQTEAETQIRQQMENSIRNEYRTKVLESAMLDLTDAAVFSFSDFILNHWLYLANIGKYNSFVTIDDPRTGEALSLSVKEAFTVFLYAINRQYGVTLQTVPTIEANLVRRIPTPSRSDIRAITEAEYLSEEMLDSLLDLPAVETNISIAGFRDNVQACYDALMRQWRTWASRHHYKERGQAEIAALHCYHDYPIDLSEGTASYEEWFAVKGYPFWDYDQFECESLAKALLEQATGAHLSNVTSTRDMQAALIRLMAKLSSYTVQFLTHINQSRLKIVDWNFVSLGDHEGLSSDHFGANLVNVGVQRLLAESLSLEQLSIYNLGVDFTVDAVSFSKTEMDLGLSIRPNHQTKVIYRVGLTDLQFRNIDETFDDFEADTPTRETVEYKPLEYLELDEAFLTLSTPQYVLTPEDHSSIEMRWIEYSQTEPQPEGLSTVITQTNLGTVDIELLNPSQPLDGAILNSDLGDIDIELLNPSQSLGDVIVDVDLGNVDIELLNPSNVLDGVIVQTDLGPIDIGLLNPSQL